VLSPLSAVIQPQPNTAEQCPAPSLSTQFRSTSSLLSAVSWPSDSTRFEASHCDLSSTTPATEPLDSFSHYTDTFPFGDNFFDLTSEKQPQQDQQKDQQQQETPADQFFDFSSPEFDEQLESFLLDDPSIASLGAAFPPLGILDDPVIDCASSDTSGSAASATISSYDSTSPLVRTASSTGMSSQPQQMTPASMSASTIQSPCTTPPALYTLPRTPPLDHSFATERLKEHTSILSTTDLLSRPLSPLQVSVATASRKRKRTSAKAKRAKSTSPEDEDSGLPEIVIVDKGDAAAVKRARNTLAARRYRQKKMDRMQELEEELEETETERDEWKAKAEAWKMEAEKWRLVAVLGAQQQGKK